MLVLLALTGCDSSEDTPEEAVHSGPPEATHLQRPDEPSIVHGDLDVVDAPVPTKFRGPFPVSVETLEVGTSAYVPWSYAHAGLCEGDEDLRARLLQSLREAAETGQLTGDLSGEYDGTYYNLLSWCRDESSCGWFAELATQESLPEVRNFAWEQVASCPVASVRSAIDSNDSPDAMVVQWYTMMGVGGDTVPPRVAAAADRMIATYEMNGEPGRVFPLANLLVRFSDERVAEWFDRMLAAADDATALDLYKMLVRSPADWAKKRVRQPCRRSELTPDECLPPAHPYDVYLFEEAPAFAASAKRFERSALLDRLEACVFSRDTVDTFHRARCLWRMADLDWRRGLRAAESFAPDEMDLTDPDLGPVIRTLLDHPDAPIQIALRKEGLIPSSPDPEAPAAEEGIGFLSVMIRYGRARTTGTGVYSDPYDQAWSLHDLARLSPALEGAAFDVLIEPTPDGPGAGRLAVAYLDGRRYSHAFVQGVDTDGVGAMLALLNGVLADRGVSERYVLATMDDYSATFLIGPPAALQAAKAAGDIEFFAPESF
jgi:hypothetical protein